VSFHDVVVVIMDVAIRILIISSKKDPIHFIGIRVSMSMQKFEYKIYCTKFVDF
jgi:hypothetical protein